MKRFSIHYSGVTQDLSVFVCHFIKVADGYTLVLSPCCQEIFSELKKEEVFV